MMDLHAGRVLFTKIFPFSASTPIRLLSSTPLLSPNRHACPSTRRGRSCESRWEFCVPSIPQIPAKGHEYGTSWSWRGGRKFRKRGAERRIEQEVSWSVVVVVSAVQARDSTSNLSRCNKTEEFSFALDSLATSHHAILSQLPLLHELYAFLPFILLLGT